MSKRIKKKQRNSKALVTLDGIHGVARVCIKKKYWNKGSRDKGVMFLNDTGDFITVEHIEKLGFKYIVQIFNSTATISFHKSITNKNRIV